MKKKKKPKQKKKKPRTILNEGREGYFAVFNMTANTISNIKISHISNAFKCPTEKEYFNLKPSETTPKDSIAYEVGNFSSLDYWHIEVTMNGITYRSEKGIYCSLAGTDNGLVLISIKENFYMDTSVTAMFFFSYSSNCSKKLR